MFKVLKTFFQEFSMVLAKKNNFFYFPIECLLIQFPCYLHLCIQHFITLYLIIARNTLILLNTFLNELMGTKKIGHFKDGAIPTILAHVKAKKNESYQSGILKWLLKSK